jgi:hypothetical protein
VSAGPVRLSSITAAARRTVMGILSWLTALAVWRFGRIEERWSHNLTG